MRAIASERAARHARLAEYRAKALAFARIAVDEAGLKDPAVALVLIKSRIEKNSHKDTSSEAIEKVVAATVAEVRLLDLMPTIMPRFVRALKAGGHLVPAGARDPQGIVAAGGDLGSWLAKQVDIELVALAELPDPALIAGPASPLFANVSTVEQAERYDDWKRRLSIARSHFAKNVGIADVVVRACAIADFPCPPRDRIQEAMATRSSEARLAREKRAEWEKHLLSKAQARESLGVTPAVFDWLVASGRLSVADRVVFRKWGKTLTANRFDPSTLSAAAVSLPEWLAERKRAPSPARSAGSPGNEPDRPQAAMPRKTSRREHITADETKQARLEALLAERRIRSGLADFPAFFPVARSMRRKFIFHAGPTNSGKTHGALEALIAAPSGCYAAPLRLMAIENRERLQTAGVGCTLVTGEERISAYDDTHTSNTVEMLDLRSPVSVGVIDEIQMLGCKDRGWAWTAAVLGMPAEVIYLTGSPDALPRIQALAALTGDDVEVKVFKRLSPLVVEKSRMTLSRLEAGDAVITFHEKMCLA